MKFVSALFVSLSIAVGSIIAKADGMSIRGNTKSANKLMKLARRLEDGAGNNNGGYNNYGYGGAYGYYNMDMDEESLFFLYDYSIKLLSCIADEQVVNYENGEMETATVVFRLCPTDSCNANYALGCDSGYGDFAVGINTFLQAYMDQQDEQQNNGGYYNGNGMVAYSSYGVKFDASEFLECAEYAVEEGGGYNGDYNNGQQYQNYNGQYNNGQQQQNGGYYQNPYYNSQFYIGPSCSADGTTIGLSMYMDEFCTYPSNIDFSEIAYGWESGIPFSDGGLVLTDCVPCYGPDEDYNWELSRMCTESYQFATSRCDNDLQTYSNSYYGSMNQGCNYVNALVESVYGSSSSTNGTEAEIYYDDENTNSRSSISSLFSWGNGWGDKWGDTANEVAAIVLFTLSLFFGMAITTCLCVKKRKERKRAKAVADGDDLLPQAEPIVKKRSSVIALVRSGSKSIAESVKTAATGAKMIVTTAASKSVASIKKEGKEGDDDTDQSDYKDMDDLVNNEDDNKSVKSGKVASVKAVDAKSVASKKSAASRKHPLPPSDP